MKLTALSDIHGQSRFIENAAADLSASDVVLLCGDITQFGGRVDAAAIINDVRPYCRRVLAVAGNCDGAGVEEYLDEIGINLNGRAILIEGTAFIGVSGSLPCPGRTPNERRDRDFKALLEKAAAEAPAGTPLVLVTHQPPYGTRLDAVGREAHVGSRGIREFIEARQPLLCFSGHIHEGVGTDAIGRTRLVNPGPLFEGGYAYAEIDGSVTLLEIRH